MLQTIFKKFGYISIKEHDENVRVLHIENESLREERDALELQVRTFKAAGEREHPIIDFSLGDPIPTDSEERKIYVSKTASFFKDILEPKLNQMLSKLHNMFEERDSDRDFDLILKGVAYAFRDLIKWGNAMINEQVANQNTNVPESDVQNLKEKLNGSLE